MQRSARLSHPVLGDIEWVTDPTGVLQLGFDRRPSAPDVLPGDPLGVAGRLTRWLDGALDALQDLPLAPAGTAYQQRVWAALVSIPPGHTRSYGEIAQQIGSVARAVGAANGANPVAIAIPCHRVIGANGDLTGYAGGLHRKRWLLQHEGVPVPGIPGALF